MKKTPCCYSLFWGRCNCFVYYSTDFAEIVYNKILILYTFDFLTQALLLPEVREERRYRYAELPDAAVHYYVTRRLLCCMLSGLWIYLWDYKLTMYIPDV